MIHQVVVWSNNMVTVMDGAGAQMTVYQGPLADVGEAILRAAPATAGFQSGTWGRDAVQPIVQIRRADFADLVSGVRTVGLIRR